MAPPPFGPGSQVVTKATPALYGIIHSSVGKNHWHVEFVDEEGQIPAEPVARDFKSQQLKRVKEGEFPGSGERRASKKKKSRVSLPRQRRNRRGNESLSSPILRRNRRGDGQEEEGSVSSKSVSSKSVSSKSASRLAIMGRDELLDEVGLL